MLNNSQSVEQLTAENTELRRRIAELERAAGACSRVDAELQNAAFLQNIIDSSIDHIFVKDLTLRTILCNAAFSRSLGKSCAEIYGKTDIEVGWDPELVKGNPEKGIRGFEADDREVLSGKVLRIASEPVNVLGEIRYFNTTKIPLRNVQNEIIGVLGIARDITERKRVEEALYSSEERLSHAVKLAGLGIWDWDVATDKTVWNDEMLRIYGITAEQFTGKGTDYINFTRADYLEKQHANIRAVFENGVTEAELLAGKRTRFEPKELCIVRPDGTECFTFGDAVAIVDEHRKPVRLLGVTIDMTERKLLEEELRQAHKMDAIGQLASGIAHDFNNQLNVILGFSELLLNKSNDSEVRNCASQIVASATCSADLVRQLLAFSRKGPYLTRLVELDALIQETLTVLSRTLDRKIALSCKLCSHARLLADSSLLTNAFLNVALNARDAMPHGGTLHFATQSVTLGESELRQLGADAKPGPYALITIADTGQGMSAEIQRHIFEPFFTTKQANHGTGLGLAAVYGTVKRHGGAIRVESSVGNGTTFSLYFPQAPQSASEALRPALESTPPRADTNRAANRILVVEDERSIRQLLSDSLSELGYTIVCRENGAAAAEYYREQWHAVDLVIMDMNMPVMDGAQALSHMRQINPEVCALIISGYGDEERIKALLRPGRVNFQAKPFRMENLNAHINQLLRV